MVTNTLRGPPALSACKFHQERRRDSKETHVKLAGLEQSVKGPVRITMLRFALCGKKCRRHAILSKALDCTKQCRCKLRETSLEMGFLVNSNCDVCNKMGRTSETQTNTCSRSHWPNKLGKQIPSRSIEFKQAFSTSEVINCTWASSLLLQQTRGITPKRFPSVPSI